MAWDSAYLWSSSTCNCKFSTAVELYMCGMEFSAHVELFNLWLWIVHTCWASYRWWCKPQQLCKEQYQAKCPVGLHVARSRCCVCHTPLKFWTTVPQTIGVPSWITMRRALIFAKICRLCKTMDQHTMFHFNSPFLATETHHKWQDLKVHANPWQRDYLCCHPLMRRTYDTGKPRLYRYP